MRTIDREFVTSAKKSQILTNFPKLKICKNSLNARVIFLLPDGYPGSEYLICRIIVYCCMNKCIINERYIPEHQNKLNIYDLQNYEFFAIFFLNRKKIAKFVIFQKMKKNRRIRILDL